jgi:hypothetical protein
MMHDDDQANGLVEVESVAQLAGQMGVFSGSPETS